MTTTAVSARRRAAALAALAGATALVVFVAVVLFRNGVHAIVGLVGLAVAVRGAWWVVTERMPRRAIGVAGVVTGLVVVAGALITALTGAERIVVRIVLVVVVLGITMACARAAMAREIRSLDLHVRAGGPPTRPVLLCNPWSGGGKVERFGIRELATELGVETVMLDHGLDLEVLARDAVARGADCLGMAGGDGSQALVASIAVEHGLPFVCVSAGTRNHFALDLGLNRDDPRESVYAFRDAYERQVDFATVNDRLFVNNVSLGVYAEIVQEDQYRDAKVDTTKALLPEMLGRQSEPFDLQFTTPDGTEVDGAILVMVSNNPYVLGVSPDNAQRRHLDRGRLGVFAVNTRTGADAARLVAAQALGRRSRSPFWHEFTATEFSVRSCSGTVFAGVDGEALELPTPLRFRIHHRGLTLLVPVGNLEVAEQRRARDVRLDDLVAVAAGHEPSRLAATGRHRVRTIVALAAILAAAGLLTDAATERVDAGDPPTTTTTTVATAPGRRFPLIAPGGLRPILKRERRSAEPAPTTTTSTTAPAPSTTPPTTPRTEPYFVGVVHRTFVDPTRSTPARGGSGGGERAIATTIYYPTTLAPSATNPKPRVATGPWPLIVFAHGYAIDAAAYAPLLEDLASAGYVVAAPDFPGTSTAYPGGAVRSDSLQQPGDISFVITKLLAASASPGLFFDAVDPSAIGDSGQSDGGVTAAAAAYNTCCIDPRIGASVILTGGSFGFDGEWFPPGTPPVMFVHATADEVNPYSASTSMFAQAQSPKHLFTIEGGSHLEVYVDPPWEEHVARAMVAFFDLYLKADPAAADRLAAEGAQPGYSLTNG